MKHLLILACIILGMSACNKDDAPLLECKTVDQTYITGNGDGNYIVEYTDGTSEISATYYSPGEEVCK